MNLFGRKKQSTTTNNNVKSINPIDAINKLKDEIDTLEKREVHISKKVEAALNEAKQKALQKNQKAALLALKRKKIYENEITKLQSARITLEQQALSLESAAVNVDIFKAMQQANNASKMIRGNLDADAVDAVMDDIQDEKDIQDQISDAITRSAFGVEDDDELLQELADLESLELSESNNNKQQQPIQQKQPANVFNLPDVPVKSTSNTTTSKNANESDGDRLLRELQASMI